MYIPRHYNLEDFLKPGKALVIYGPRQVGKTTLLNEFLNRTSYKYKLDYGDNIVTQNLFKSQVFDELFAYVKGYELLVIDEAQNIENIGMGLKILVDHVKDLRIIVTGSSSFELAGQVGEPLVGRKITLKLYPLALMELNQISNEYELKQSLDDFLIFGQYPAVLTSDRLAKTQILEELVSSHLLKDILILENVKGSKVLLDLLRLVAFQIGNEVSMSELGKSLGIDAKTVARYLDLFEKSFILFNLRGYSRNLRSEITKKSKYYFYDNGIRNALISNFNTFNKRDDIGKLWENFLVSERIKKQSYTPIYSNNFFWRTWEQKEIDWLEEREGKLFGYEFKYNKSTFTKPKDFLAAYPEGSVELVSRNNFLEFVS